MISHIYLPCTNWGGIPPCGGCARWHPFGAAIQEARTIWVGMGYECDAVPLCHARWEFECETETWVHYMKKELG